MQHGKTLPKDFTLIKGKWFKKKKKEHPDLWRGRETLAAL